jgi:hypothetical protein
MNVEGSKWTEAVLNALIFFFPPVFSGLLENFTASLFWQRVAFSISQCIHETTQPAGI